MRVHPGAATFVLQPEVEPVIFGLVEVLSAQACGQGLAETVIEQLGRDARQDLHLLGLLEEEEDAGATKRVLRDVDLRIAAGRGLVSGAPALPAAGGQMTFHANL